MIEIIAWILLINQCLNCLDNMGKAFNRNETRYFVKGIANIGCAVWVWEIIKILNTLGVG